MALLIDFLLKVKKKRNFEKKSLFSVLFIFAPSLSCPFFHSFWISFANLLDKCLIPGFFWSFFLVYYHLHGSNFPLRSLHHPTIFREREGRSGVLHMGNTAGAGLPGAARSQRPLCNLCLSNLTLEGLYEHLFPRTTGS